MGIIGRKSTPPPDSWHTLPLYTPPEPAPKTSLDKLTLVIRNWNAECARIYPADLARELSLKLPTPTPEPKSTRRSTRRSTRVRKLTLKALENQHAAGVKKNVKKTKPKLTIKIPNWGKHVRALEREKDVEAAWGLMGLNGSGPVIPRDVLQARFARGLDYLGRPVQKAT